MTEPTEEKPPFFKSWAGMYGLLMGTLAFFVLLFYLFTQHYS